MNKTILFICKSIFTFISIVIILLLINTVLISKQYFNDNWPTTATYDGFYRVDSDSIDVICLGSSHMATSFIPQVLYDETGITSYNLGCGQQNLLVSYYWLEEALRYQRPKKVILDVYMLFDYSPTEPLNTAESSTRMAIDPMRWSSVKVNAVNDICKYDTTQTFNSYLFTNLRFHSRWSDLKEEDFRTLHMRNHYELKGYTPLNGKNGDANYSTLIYDDSRYEDTMNVMDIYFNKIVELCRNNDIDLILVKTPAHDASWNIGMHNTVLRIATEQNLTFIDFNTEELFSGLDFDFVSDMSDGEHPNIWGAEKITKYIAGLLCDDIDIGSEANQWSETASYYQQIKKDLSLLYVDDFLDYVDYINDKNYSILVTSRFDTSYFMTDELKSAFRELGLEFDVDGYKSYCAVITSDSIYEDTSVDTIVYANRIDSKDYYILSNNWNSGRDISIMVDGVERAINHNGLNIVVYSNEREMVVDSIFYDGKMGR